MKHRVKMTRLLKEYNFLQTEEANVVAEATKFVYLRLTTINKIL